MALIVALAGRRQSGKSKIAQYLRDSYGFESYHPFNPGKAATKAYLIYAGVDGTEAERMVNGDLKDVSCDRLPIVDDPNHHLHGKHADPRYFMERFGKFMGVEMGPGWTLGIELRRVLEENPDQLIVVESIVYEEATLRDLGATIIMVERAQAQCIGMETDKYTKLITPDVVFTNDGEDLDELYVSFDNFLREQLGERLPCRSGDEARVPEPF